jgi:hypothetical protein
MLDKDLIQIYLVLNLGGNNFFICFLFYRCKDLNPSLYKGLLDLALLIFAIKQFEITVEVFIGDILVGHLQELPIIHHYYKPEII